MFDEVPGHDSIDPVIGIKALSLVVREFHDQNSANILKLLLNERNCILKYGDEHQDISQILRCCYEDLVKQTS